MDNSTQNLIDQEVKKLPKNMQQALKSFDWMTEAMMIVRDAGMGIDAVENFQKETAIILLGLDNTDNYISNIAESLDINIDLAQSLASSANIDIFSELQRRISQPQDTNEQSHEEIAGILSDEGIDLLDHDTDMSIPSNIHEDVHNLQQQFEKQEMRDRHIYGGTSSPSPIKTSIANIKPTRRIKSDRDYTEEISDQDLKGVGQHRLDTSILKSMSPLQAKALEDHSTPQTRDFEKSLLSQTRVSQDDNYDASPLAKEDLFKAIKNEVKENDE